MFITRRRLLTGGVAAGGLAGAAMIAAGWLEKAALTQESNAFYTALPIPQMLDARQQSNAIALTAQSGMAEIMPNYPAPAYGYSSPYLGPVVRVHRGDTVAMTIKNALDKATTLHWHGLSVPSELDGGPYGTIDPGQTWQPSLKIDQPASTAWYHPHPHGDTGRQIYMGLAGLLYIEDGSATDLGLPDRYGLDDIPLILQDRIFSDDGEMLYDDSPMAIMHGARGDTLVVNGAIGPVAEVPRAMVRLRLLNAANARNFRLTFDDGRPLIVVASDNGFLASPVAVSELTISPGERYEVLVDFTMGASTTLLTFEDHNGRFGNGIGQQIKSYAARALDTLIPVVRFDMSGDISAAVKRVPDKLSGPGTPVIPDDATRRFFILDSMTALNVPIVGGDAMDAMDQSQMAGTMGGKPSSGLAKGMRMGINGKTFDPGRIDVEAKLGSSEIWELRGTEMAHPFHIHGASFRILNLDGADPPSHLAGAKDTVLVNEHAQILVSFNQPASKAKPFMFHCHILEHEDAGMMGQFTAV